MKLLRTGISNFMYWATWGETSVLPTLIQRLWASLPCKAQSPEKPISALIQGFFIGRSQGSFSQGWQRASKEDRFLRLTPVS